MSKKYRRKNRQRALELIFYGLLIVGVLLLIALAILPDDTAGSSGYVITEDGHVHAADGTHIGTYDESTGYVITADGHVHTIDGAHIGTVSTEEGAAATEDGAVATEDGAADAEEEPAGDENKEN